MSATNWSLKLVSFELDRRPKSSSQTDEEKREHKIVERYKISDEGFTEATGNTTSQPITYYVGSEERSAVIFPGSKWLCTYSAAEESQRGVNWRTITERWECFGKWSTITGIYPA